MLLASDGSTTKLLEALLGEELKVAVHEIRSATGKDVSEAVCQALQLAPDTPVLVRRSALVTSAGLEVSRNHVVARGPFDGDVGRVLTGTDPIGRTMNGSRSRHSRVVLETGWSCWETDDDVLRCAFKAYVLAEDDRPTIHVVERFNPSVVPATWRAVKVPVQAADSRSRTRSARMTRAQMRGTR